MNRRLAFASLASVAWLAGCAGDGSPGPATPEPDGTPVENTLLVRTTYDAGHPWIVYREGAMAEIILRDDAGQVVDRRIVRPGRPVEFRDLPAGDYRLEPALRPCDGNCGYLDPRMDDCRATVAVTRSVRVRVDFAVGDSCTLHGPALA
jgi:hypothetical protein